MKLMSLLGACIASLAVSGCTGEQAAVACGSFSSTLAIKDRLNQPASVFNTTEPIFVSLQITNNSFAAAYLYGYSSCDNVRFQVTDSNGQPVWPVTHQICVANVQPAPTAPNLGPSESLTFGAVLPGGEPTITPEQIVRVERVIMLAPGTYRVQAEADLVTHDANNIVYSCRESLSRSGTFEIH
jgi:hypothetical protein